MSKPRDHQKREAIFTATLSLVLQTGFAGLRMADVAKKAGVATGTVYKYFPSKESLIDELFLHQKEIKIKEMSEGFVAGEPFHTSFVRMWRNYFKGCIRNPERMIFIEQFYKSPFISDETRFKAEEMLKPLENLLQSAVQQQIIIDMPVPVILSQLMGAANEIAKYHIDSGIPPGPGQLEQYTEMGWNSIRK